MHDFLLSHGFASVNQPRTRQGGLVQLDGMYPIHVAVVHGNADILSLLLEFGADPDETYQGFSTVQMAEEADEDGSHQAVLRLLAEALKLESVSF